MKVEDKNQKQKQKPKFMYLNTDEKYYSTKTKKQE